MEYCVHSAFMNYTKYKKNKEKKEIENKCENIIEMLEKCKLKHDCIRHENNYIFENCNKSIRKRK